MSGVLALTDKEVRALPQRSQRYRVSDGTGLLLEVDPAGGKYWLWRHRFPPTKDGRRQDRRIGPYPRISLKAARDIRGVISQVLDYAVAIGHCTINPAHSLKRHAPVKQTTSHYPCIPWSELPELLAAMRANAIGAEASTLHAMGLLALTFVRTR